MELIKNIDFTISYIVKDNNIYFKGKDVALALQYKDTDKAVRMHVYKEDKIYAPRQNGGVVVCINESGLYSLIFGSKMKIARKFKRWVTSEVLPTIRKTGQYTQSTSKKNEKPHRYIKYNNELDIHTENDLHHAVISYLNKLIERKHKRVKYSIGMGEYLDTSDKRVDAFKKGYISGCPDIIIHNKTFKYDGMVIELKTPKATNDISTSQNEQIEEYRELKYKVLISNDYSEVITKINSYIHKIRIPCLYCNKRFKNCKTRKNHYKYFHRIQI
jgi:prophage antirepressor-like protein